jgi:hypothetical protein
LQVALQGIVTQYELDKLVGLNKESPFLVIYSDDMNNELQRLQAMGLIQNHEGVGLWTIRNYYKDRAEAFDLKQFFSITEQGKEYMKLRTELLVLL